MDHPVCRNACRGKYFVRADPTETDMFFIPSALLIAKASRERKRERERERKVREGGWREREVNYGYEDSFKNLSL